ncbi:MAG: transcriptional regulator [Oceanospirillaceae bacterium]|nr:transcriptional regulator [Oceanospirillaceae bacterium]MBT11002.1 transcriptional regulator [Oceanospirillaceae bacterium]|tara:strand:+ start:186 stop:506 length:321 start_codon:yes stop_codon:yes gene_type:complete
MKDELFNDLLTSAKEMVSIEKGYKEPAKEDSHSYDLLDVKAIREAAGKNRDEFALILGISAETIKSWETKRRNPTGPTQKLLRLIQINPEKMINVLEEDTDFKQQA